METEKKVESKATHTINKKPLYNFVKRFLDVVISFLILVVLLPLFIVFSMIIFLADFHYPIYFQTRIGRKGKEFRLIKFRTMRPDAHDLKKYFSEEQLKLYNSEYKIEDDPRVTKFGRFLRKFSIDELPQVINVISGHMSLIGPRPLTDEETHFFGENRDLLLSVRPGITGLWQVSGRNDLTYESGERQKCELEYVENFGFVMDFKVFVKTFKEIFSGNGK